MAKSGYEKGMDKLIKANEKSSRKQEKLSKAQSIVDGARSVSGFRIMDDNSEALLKEIIDQYDGNEENRVEFDLANISRPVRDFASVGYEALEMYGMISRVLSTWGRGARLTLSESGKNYFHTKQNILDKENEMAEREQSIVSIQGNGNQVMFQSDTVDSSQTFSITNADVDFEAVERMLDQLSTYQSVFEQEFGEQRLELEQNITEAKTAVAKKNLAMLKKPLKAIKDILENAAGSFVAAGALGMISQISGLFL